MPGSSNASFIPKRNTVNRERQGARRQVYVGTIIVRIAFIAVLLSVAAIFFYKGSLQKDLNAEVVGLSDALNAFNEADLQRVQLVDTKIKEVGNLMAYTVSTKTILEAVEASTLGSAKITNFDLERTDRETINVSAQFEAPSFDAVLFQKGVYTKNSILTLEKLEEIAIELEGAGDGGAEVVSGEIAKLGFGAKLVIEATDVPHTIPAMLENSTAPAVEEVTAPAETTDVVEEETANSNEDIL